MVLALPKAAGDLMEHMLRPAGAQLVRLGDALAVLADLETNPGLDLIVLHASVLGDNPVSLLRAMSRLAPNSAFLVMGFASDPGLAGTGIPAILAPEAPAPAELAGMLLEAAGLSAARHGRTARPAGGAADSPLRSG